jgi:Tfp pilus assembly protein PilX
MQTLLSTIRSERGSVLLAALVLLAVMTILGLALFDLGVIENRLAASDVSEARAFEIAQAGLERAMERLLRTMVNEWDDATIPRPDVGWHNGNTAANAAICSGGPASTGGCESARFRTADSTYISNTSFNGGSYAISFKLLTVAEAGTNPYGQVCLPRNVGGTDYCRDLIFVRSTGTVTGVPAGYTASRTIQALARASSTSPFSGGITAGAPSGNPMNGNVKIAGSIHIVGDPGTAAISFGGTAGQRNNWADLDSTSLARITPLPLVCPPGRSCPTDANKVESLGAKLHVARPIASPAVSLSGGADLGQSGDTASYGTPARKGKGPLDEVAVADGCVMPCTDNFTGVTVGSNMFVDGNNITKPYPGTPQPFPLLTDPVKIAGTSYLHYACVAGSSCFGAPAGQEFFVNHAANLTADAFWSGSLGSAGGLTDATATGATGVFTFTNKAGVATTGIVCWDQPSQTLTLGLGATCGTAVPAPPSNPLLIYTTNPNFKIERNGGPTAYTYKGSAIVVTTGVVKIEEAMQTFCTAAPCTGERYPDNQLLAVLTNNRMEIGKSNANIDRIMVLLYTEGDLYSEKQTNIVGTATAFRFCMAGGTCPLSSGGNVPSFFQVPSDPTLLPEELFPGGAGGWTVTYVPRFWLECRRGTPPATVSGVCGY